jgi:hypothetical protein
MRLKTFLLILIAYFVTFLPACGQKKSDTDGTSDPGGGGIVKFSTSEEVTGAIERARLFLVSDKGRRFLEIHLPSALGSDSESSQRMKSVLQKIVNPNAWSMKNDPNHVIAESSISSYLAKSQIKLFPNDTALKNCAGPGYESYPDAYVSSFHYGSEICFNVQRLGRVPAESLHSQLVALWIHELAHISGYNEDTARAAGELVSSTISKFNSGDANATLQAMSGILNSAYFEFSEIKYPLSSKDRLLLAEDKIRLSTIVSYVKTLSEFQPFVDNLDAVYALNPDVGVMDRTALLFKRQVESSAHILKAIQGEIDTTTISRDSLVIHMIDDQLACTAKSLTAIATILHLSVANINSYSIRYLSRYENINDVNCP